jgi:hypothetical protein
MVRFAAQDPNGLAVQQLELLIRTAIFKPANAVVGLLLQQAADQIDAVYQPKPGQARKGREKIHVQGIFGRFELNRDYYYHEGKKQGHYPADAALGLETGYTPALARLICLEGADETSYQKAETHLLETAGIELSARQIQRVAQRVGVHAQQWQQREVVQRRRDRRAHAQGRVGGAPGQRPRRIGENPPILPGLRLHSAWSR